MILFLAWNWLLLYWDVPLFELLEFVWPIVWFDCLLGGTSALKNFIYLALLGDKALDVAIPIALGWLSELENDWKSLPEGVP